MCVIGGSRIDQDPSIPAIHLPDEKRGAHLPELFCDLAELLRKFCPLETHALESRAAKRHGKARRDQGYTAATVVEESRLLQVSIFQTLQNNLRKLC